MLFRSETKNEPRASWAGAFAALVWRGLLAIFYFGVLTPISLFARLAGVEFLKERFTEQTTYWIRRPLATTSRI